MVAAYVNPSGPGTESVYRPKRSQQFSHHEHHVDESSISWCRASARRSDFCAKFFYKHTSCVGSRLPPFFNFGRRKRKWLIAFQIKILRFSQVLEGKRIIQNCQKSTKTSILDKRSLGSIGHSLHTVLTIIRQHRPFLARCSGLCGSLTQLY